MSPPLAWLGEPAGTKSFALIVDDPDAREGTCSMRQNSSVPIRRATRRMDDRQFEELLERVKVSIAMKERMLSAQTEGRNQAVDRLAYRVATTPERTIIASGFAGQGYAACFEHLQAQQAPPDLLRSSIVADTLKHLAQDDIGQGEPLVIEFRVQPFGFGILYAMEIVNPNRRVDDDHGLLRRPVQTG